MKKTLSIFISKVREVNEGQLKEGFVTLKNLRGGVLPSNNGGSCTNETTCTGTNSSYCTNSGDCKKATNSSTHCSNTGTCPV